MGCGSSTRKKSGNTTISPIAFSSNGSKDAEAIYRERLGPKFIHHFSQSSGKLRRMSFDRSSQSLDSQPTSPFEVSSNAGDVTIMRVDGSEESEPPS
ncbi:hypothetical protein GUITHDRAFT_154412 [Guillardia theta CCMP2712]|uniref:Uncharacterized protein n=1 Tax=Guillardia theta (strain CCMP2712) TaxID=905079 RepID=L1ITK2_GUITC|nr:hypothetical protein GUITHDRAFT_154412 [Guillardia theta CCMP2712]EKX39427.1 hypothetical protein GUITHDRAFT_154412 [Guillardia theta CCMP2712]|mmetsp:Transcript_41834/g.131922  ORF Transcript_41834/g.131922 Transcript_41834/m.131922 type:complete len:97 (+) Transcript_41834:109-399(+)|eukprot:XP_005826407.1 hypothetical protein GUITHDRAFT_154412 [Guillardia theta CCMP2712]